MLFHKKEMFDIQYGTTGHYHIKILSGSCTVPLQFRSIDISTVFHNVLRYFRTLDIVWSLVRRRVTRRLTRLETMFNVLKYRNYFKTFRRGCGAVVVILSIYLCALLYTRVNSTSVI